MACGICVGTLSTINKDHIFDGGEIFLPRPAGGFATILHYALLGQTLNRYI